MQGTAGNLYGTTDAGEAEGFGTVFKITPGGVLTTLHSFVPANGANPAALWPQRKHRAEIRSSTSCSTVEHSIVADYYTCLRVGRLSVSGEVIKHGLRP